MSRYVGALDQGTTSTRFMVFDVAGAEVARRQIEHAQILPQPGWVFWPWVLDGALTAQVQQMRL